MQSGNAPKATGSAVPCVMRKKTPQENVRPARVFRHPVRQMRGHRARGNEDRPPRTFTA